MKTSSCQDCRADPVFVCGSQSEFRAAQSQAELTFRGGTALGQSLCLVLEEVGVGGELVLFWQDWSLPLTT